MNEIQEANRRNVLKTLGAGVVGATALTGTATASKDNPDVTIVLDNFRFDPRSTSVTLDSDETAVVRWEHQHLINGKSPPHDVLLFESSDHSGTLVQSSDGSDEDLWYGQVYEVKFTEDTSTNELVLDEVRDDSSSTDDTGVRVDFSGGSVTLHMHCSHHDPGMAGSLTITK